MYFYQTATLVICLMLGASSDDGYFRREKRLDIDLQTCIDNFNVHKDKIIRTLDSQNMGAKYLNEIDLGSREECLRLCCETDNCDVFVFEEKNSGSCYLFHCGPPEDFKCKFTHHVNYSSGVLSINRHLPDLESQIKLTKHEQDLTKLRKPETDPGSLRPLEVKSTSLPTTALVASKELLPDSVSKGKSVEGREYDEMRKCSRFQFECRSTGDCIAIYNACDGIAQCPDGSDEAPELGCPDSLTTSVPIQQPTRPIGQSVPSRYQSNLMPPQVSQMNNAQNVYVQPQQQPQQIQQPLIPHPDADFLRPVNDPRNAVQRIPYDNQLQPYGPPIPVQNQGNWYQHQSNQIPSQYVDKNSHIFIHKENGLQVPDGQEMRYNKYKGAMQYLHHSVGVSNTIGGQMQYADNSALNYPKTNKGSYYGDGYRQPIQQENWPIDEGSYENHQKYLQDVNQDKTKNKPPYYIPEVTNNKQELEPVNPPHVQEKLAHDLKHSKEHMEHGDTHEKIKIEHVHHEQYPDVVPYHLVDGDLQDGKAETPKGAIISLTFGLILTVIMIIMLGCRLKMVRRRFKRGGKAYAHEADFLVNGMYL